MIRMMHYMCCVVVQSANNRLNGGGEILQERCAMHIQGGPN